MYIRVKNDGQDDKQAIEVPVGDNGSVSLTTLAAIFPKIMTLKYWSTESNHYRT
jgi:hypothetical protein